MKGYLTLGLAIGAVGVLYAPRYRRLAVPVDSSSKCISAR